MDTAPDQPQPSEVNPPASNGEPMPPKHSIDAPAAETPDEPPAKKTKVDDSAAATGQADDGAPMRKKGVAPVKAEYIVASSTRSERPTDSRDDAAEAARHEERQDEKKGKKKKERGQNKARTFGRSEDEKPLCGTRAFHPELSPTDCQFGDTCKFEHNLRTYLKQYKREDLTTFSVCPVYEARGKCYFGWRCRFVGSHMKERDTEDGQKELVLIEDEERRKKSQPLVPYASEDGIVNAVSTEDKLSLSKKRTKTQRADEYSAWLDKTCKELERALTGRRKDENDLIDEAKEQREDNRSQFTEAPFLPSEKRRIYFGPETPVLAPLTTQGNMPFRRLCTELGAQATYSEMAMSMPLVQGSRSEWALMKAHESEMLPPTISPKNNVVESYDNSKDFRFGAQISANKPWQALKATEVLAKFAPHLRVIDLNCGCPIDLVYREGAGSALLDSPAKLERIIRGMNAVSGEIPVTAKIRLGTKDSTPSALKNVERLVLGGYGSTVLDVGPPGTAAITLHGRSRQQRYTRQADWGYIAECSALIKRLNEKKDALADTVREPDERMLPNGGRVYFLGNGDCYSQQDYFNHTENAGVDSVMIARGALIKPWIFEEIQTGQYLDKSASERLSHIEKFARYGLEAWGSDEHGVGTTRRFLLEWMNFTHRYVPLGLLEYLPPNIQDRPPVWRGRNDLETLLGSGNYKDWIKVTEMFLGPAHKDFKFEPKHKSNAYEAEG